MRRASLWAPPVLMMALIFYSSSQSDPAPAITAVVWDKALHASGYALLAILFTRAWLGEGLSLGRATLFAILCTSLYGASDEVHQLSTPGRESDVRDWMSDTVGAAIGTAAFSTLLRQRHRPRR